MNIENHLDPRYKLIECIARGGMGEVWKALDQSLNRHVALKFLRLDHQNYDEFVPRFTQEAQLIASLSHPHIVKLHNFYSAPAPSGRPLCYMIMDYVQGPTLAQYITRTSRSGFYPPMADVIYILTCVARAVDYAHQRGLLHRDIKPANILLDQRSPTEKGPGRPILSDFGISRRIGASSGTAIGSILGTPAYISPEQALGRYDDPRSDLYSLGIILYEIMTGRQPFISHSPLSIIMQHVNEDPMPPELLNSHISAEVSQVILRGIAKEPEQRFPTALALIQALAQASQIPMPTSSYASSPAWSSPDLRSFSGEIRRETPRFEQLSVPVADLDTITTENDKKQVKFIQTEHRMQIPQTISIPARVEQRQGFNKKWSLALLLLAFLVIAGASGLWFWLTRPTPDNANRITGRITFIKNQQGEGYGTLQVDLEEVAELPAGQKYYAWLIPNHEEIYHSWELAVDNQTIHSPPLNVPGRENLLIPESLILITQERADTAPVVPDTNPQARLYYASIPADPLPTLDIRPCPMGEESVACI